MKRSWFKRWMAWTIFRVVVFAVLSVATMDVSIAVGLAAAAVVFSVIHWESWAEEDAQHELAMMQLQDKWRDDRWN